MIWRSFGLPCFIAWIFHYIKRHKKPPRKGEVPAICGRRGSSPHVRGGSISRRGLNQSTGNRAQLAWARTSKRTNTPIPSYSSGGGPGEGKTAIAASGGCAWLSFSTETSGHRPRRLRLRMLLLEKRPPPELSPRSSPPQSPLVCLHHGFRHLGRLRDSGVTDGKGGKLTYLRGNRNAGELL